MGEVIELRKAEEEEERGGKRRLRSCQVRSGENSLRALRLGRRRKEGEGRRERKRVSGWVGRNSPKEEKEALESTFISRRLQQKSIFLCWGLICSLICPEMKEKVQPFFSFGPPSRMSYCLFLKAPKMFSFSPSSPFFPGHTKNWEDVVGKRGKRKEQKGGKMQISKRSKEKNTIKLVKQFSLF